MEREQSLEKLQAKVAQYDAALSKVAETSTNLGGGNGPIRLDYNSVNLSELDLSTRITKAVEIRRQIITRTLPKLDRDRAGLVIQIENHTESRLLSNIEFVRSFLGQGATEKELELAEQALKNYRAKTAESQPSAPITPVTPAEPQAPSEDEERRMEALVAAIQLNMGNPDNFILPAYEGNQDPMSLEIEELNLSSRSYNALKHYAVNTVGELLSIDIPLQYIRNIGEGSEIDILAALIQFGVTIKPETQGPEASTSPVDNLPAEQELVVIFSDGKTLIVPNENVKKLIEALMQRSLNYPQLKEIVYGQDSAITEAAVEKLKERANIILESVGKEIVMEGNPSGKGRKRGEKALFKIIDKIQEEIPDAENQRREQAILDVINSVELSNIERKILEALIIHSEQNPISSSQWAQKVYGNEIPVIEAIHRLGVMRLGALEKVSSQIQLINVAKRGQAGWYFLKLVEAEASTAPPKPEFGAEPGVETAGPSRSGTREKQTINMPDGRILEVYGKRGKGIKFIVSNNQFSVKDFAKSVYGSDNQSAINASRTLLRDTKDYLTNLGWEVNIPKELKNIDELISISIRKIEGPSTPLVETPPAPYKEGEAAKDYSGRFMKFIKTLPTGKEIEIRGQKTAEAFDLIMNTTKENPISTAKISNIVVSNLRKILEPLGYKINQTLGYGERRPGQKGAYYLEKIKEDEFDLGELQAELDKLRLKRQDIAAKIEGGILTDPSSTTILSEIDLIITQKEMELRLLTLTGEEVDAAIVENPGEIESPPDTGVKILSEDEEVRFIPYIPSEDEKRSQEEDKILNYLISALAVDGKIRFEELQAEVFTNKRVAKAPGGGRRIFIYSAKELKDMFRSAIRKLREEAEIPNVREGWSEDDKKLWEKTQQATNTLSYGNIADFIRKALLEIDRSEREFYRNSPPPENGSTTVPYIKL